MKKLLLTAALAIVVYSVLVLAGDMRGTGAALESFDPRWLPAILGLPLANYFLRFLKWHYFLGRAGIRPGFGRSLQVFLAGFSMTVSPGKFGELLKSCLLRDREGIPVSRTSPVVVAERITDLMSMTVLAAAGAALAGGAAVAPVIAAGALVTAASVAVLSSRRIFGALAGLACRIRPLRGRSDSLCSFRDTCGDLLGPASLAVSVPLGVLSWGLEAMVIAAAARSIGLGTGAGTALLAHSAGTIAGAVSMIPGGLGLTELTMDGILSGPLGGAGAAAVTLLMRFATLWFAVLIGAVFLAIERTGRRNSAPVGCVVETGGPDDGA